MQFHHHDYMPGYTPRAAASRLNLTEDESDLVYHVVCSRDRPDGAPAAGLAPLEAFWFTTDEDTPRSTADAGTASPRVRAHQRVQSRGAVVRGADPARVLSAADARAGARRCRRGSRDINQVFCAADWLAIHYQKRVFWTLKIGHACALLTGVGYLIYTDVWTTPLVVGLIIAVMLASVGINALAVRSSWHRKYLDYRTLAEGLRVQFYWAAAGVTSGNVTKFAHDNFLQMQDTELGWIRNVMRVAGMECDVAPVPRPAGTRVRHRRVDRRRPLGAARLLPEEIAAADRSAPQDANWSAGSASG